LPPRFYRAVRSYAGRLKSRHDEFRMTHFMYSLPEDIRKDIGWPQYEDRPYRRQR
jgi:hypothetical protein